eukprot:6177803-Pleurochrysis_carterae.AAC.4
MTTPHRFTYRHVSFMHISLVSAMCTLIIRNYSIQFQIITRSFEHAAHAHCWRGALGRPVPSVLTLIVTRAHASLRVRAFSTVSTWMLPQLTLSHPLRRITTILPDTNNNDTVSKQPSLDFRKYRRAHGSTIY